MSSMMRTSLIVGALLAAVAAWAAVSGKLPWASGAGTSQSGKSGSAAKGGAGARAVPVEVAAARRAQMTEDIRSVGSLQSDETVRLASEIAGRVVEINFAEGQPVKKGEVMVRLDDALAKAELAQAQARLMLASANNARAQTLSRTGNVTERAQDEARATFETATAEVELAKTRIDKHLIRAPFPGVAGIRSVSVGAFLSPGAAIVNVEKIDQLKVDFKAPEIHLAAIAVGQEVAVTVDALPDRTFKGAIYAIDPAIDVNGRALSIRARLANEGAVLKPGLFARITVRGRQVRDVVMVPEGAIVPRGGETLIFAVENGKAVEIKVTLGDRRNGEVAVTEGLKPEARVVIAGQQRLRDGIAVEVVPTVAPAKAGAPGARAANGNRS